MTLQSMVEGIVDDPFFSELITHNYEILTGSDWDLITGYQAGVDVYSWAAMAIGKDNVIIAVGQGGAQGCIRSTDGGQTWANITIPNEIWTGIETDGNGNWIACSQNGNGLARSIDNGLTWTAITGFSLAYQSIAYDNGRFVVVALDNTTDTVKYTDDVGLSWTSVTPPETNQFRAIVAVNGYYIVTCTTGQHRAMYSPDAITWTMSADSVADTDFDQTFNQMAVDLTTGKIIAIEGGGTVGMYSTDNGITWTFVAALVDDAPIGGFNEIAFTTQWVLMAAPLIANPLYYSTDGETFLRGTTPSAGYWSQFVQIPQGKAMGIAYSGSGNRIIESNNIVSEPIRVIWNEQPSSALLERYDSMTNSFTVKTSDLTNFDRDLSTVTRSGKTYKILGVEPETEGLNEIVVGEN